MDEKVALDEAVLIFLEAPVDLPLRDRLSAAVAAHRAALTRCPACQGSKHILKMRGQAWTAASSYNHPTEVSDGQLMPCVACGGDGIDHSRMVWGCVSEFNPCRPRPEPEAGHEGCGWTAAPVQADPAPG